MTGFFVQIYEIFYKVIQNTIRIMEKKSPQKLAYMAFAARDPHNSIGV